MNNELSSVAQLMLPALDEEMRTVLRFDGSPPEPFLGMMHYQMGWVDESLQPIEQISGKRIRPLVCMITNDAAGGDWRQVVPAAAAIEILHNFSLVHDDIEDVSPTRRGRPTVWKLWGEADGDQLWRCDVRACPRVSGSFVGNRNAPVNDSTRDETLG